MATTTAEYTSFTGDLLMDVNRICAALAGVSALADRQADDADEDSVYERILIDQVKLQLDALRDKIDANTFNFTAKA